MSKQIYNIGIVGGTGYAGAELLRILVQHPGAKVTAVTSRSEEGKPLSSIYPQFRGLLDINFSPATTDALADCDIVFFATPHAAAMKDVPALLKAGKRVVDLSADFRLKDAELWADWYGQPHACPEYIEQAVYGLPELNREAIAKTDLVACAGCYPTAVILGYYPLLKEGLIETSGLIADSKTGVSGAGKKVSANFIFSEVSDSFKAYGVGGHRHLPEIKQALQSIASQEVGLTFVPHLVPMIRGLHATLYGRATRQADLQTLFENTYKDEPFVDVLPAGQVPETRHVRGSNMCRIGVSQSASNGDSVIVLSAIDNLVKGAAGQAVQCFNIMTGQAETTGLLTPAGVP